MEKQLTSHPNLVIVLLGFASSALLLVTLFSIAMLNYNDGVTDWEYFWYALRRIVIISIFPATLIALLRIRKWYLALAIGCVVGFILAVVYVQLI